MVAKRANGGNRFQWLMVAALHHRLLRTPHQCLNLDSLSLANYLPSLAKGQFIVIMLMFTTILDNPIVLDY